MVGTAHKNLRKPDVDTCLFRMRAKTCIGLRPLHIFAHHRAQYAVLGQTTAADP